LAGAEDVRKGDSAASARRTSRATAPPAQTTVAPRRPSEGRFFDCPPGAIGSAIALAAQPTTSITEILVVTGDRWRVDGDVRYVERTILDAARGSLMQLAWFTEAETSDELAVNPEHVVLVRTARP
jgi:hypothetical protein